MLRQSQLHRQAGKNKLSLDELNRLHSVLIEDTRFIQAGLRLDEVFLGQRDHNDDPLPEFIGSRPDDLDVLMAGIFNTNERMRESELDAVLQATATAFGFVSVRDGPERRLSEPERQRVEGLDRTPVTL